LASFIRWPIVYSIPGNSHQRWFAALLPALARYYNEAFIHQSRFGSM
jgi:hypothetical protein